jgi:hypothetical protein
MLPFRKTSQGAFKEGQKSLSPRKFDVAFIKKTVSAYAHSPGNGKTFKGLGVIPKDKNLVESFPSDYEGLVWATTG